MTEMLKKVLPFKVKEIAPRVLEFVGSTEDKDRQGDIIMADGWQLKQYKKNPVFMWAHGYADPPVGKAIEVWAAEGKLKFHIQFAEREEYEFADTIYKLYKGGYLRASSVGFLPIESEPIDKDDEGLFGVPTRFLKQELLELSGCPVPANPNALAEAKAKGLIFETDLSKFKTDLSELETESDPEKPYPNEHACRLRDPGDFRDNSFRRTERDHDGKKYSVIRGILKEGEEKWEDQAFRYKKDTWTAAEAGKHCKDHDGTFEPASTEESEKETYTCECIECGHKLETSEHCKDIKCPKCGGKMRRVERPGPGQEAADYLQVDESSLKAFSQEVIADDLDYLGTAIETVGLNKENIERAWKLVRTIFECNEVREPGSDIPVDITEKVGAVLNKVNRERLEKVRELAQQVLDSAERPEEEEEEPDKSVSVEEAKTIIQETMTAVIEKAQGKIRR